MTSPSASSDAGTLADEVSPSRRWDEPAVLIALVAILVGAVWAALLSAPSTPSSDSPEAGFARDMMRHHAQAVEMAEIVRPRTQDETIRILATDIALTQQAQIGQFQGWLAAWGLPINVSGQQMAWMGHPTMGLMTGLATDEEIDELRQLPPPEMDARFLQMMIPHHRAALGMARGALALTESPPVVEAAQKTLQAQGAEIQQMQDLLEARGYPRVPPEETMMPPMAAHGDTGAGALRDILRLAPIGIGLLALAWLVIDSMRRRQIWAGLEGPARDYNPLFRAIALISIGLSGLIHVGLTPEHLEESTATGVFFGASGVVLLLIAAWLLAWPRSAGFAVGATTSVALIVVYLLSRTTSIFGDIEPFDALGIVTVLIEVVAVVVCLVLVRSQTGEAAAANHALEPSD